MMFSSPVQFYTVAILRLVPVTFDVSLDMIKKLEWWRPIVPVVGNEDREIRARETAGRRAACCAQLVGCRWLYEASNEGWEQSRIDHLFSTKQRMWKNRAEQRFLWLCRTELNSRAEQSNIETKQSCGTEQERSRLHRGRAKQNTGWSGNIG